MAGPVISALTYTVTDTTIVATWTTDASADSNLSAGGKAAIDNGVAANGTSHQAIVTGLTPNTVYSCVVTSTSAGGTTSSTPSNQTTSAPPARKVVKSAVMGAITTVGNAPQGDTYRTFVSSDNKTYITQDDGNGFVAGSPNSAYNTQLGVLTSETTMAGTFISLANYGAKNTLTGTDGPAGDAMTNKSTGLFGLNGNLHMFVYRQYPPTYSTNRYCNWIKSTDHGATWNNFTALSTFTAAGNPVTPNSPAEPIQFYDKTIGEVVPVLYAADDGTLGYNTAGNQIDGANGYVYMTYRQDLTPQFLMRIPRIQFDAQNAAAIQYWVGPRSPSPADFVNDSNWSSSHTSPTNINSALASGGWVQIAFVPTINSYIMTTWQVGVPSGTAFNFYSAPTPAGPWTSFFVQQNPTVGSQWYGPFPFHRDLAANALSDAIPVKIFYNGESSGANYKPNWSTLTLSLLTPITQLATYAFTTIENPLSDGGNFTICPTYNALKVPSSGVCEGTAVSTNCLMYWSGPIIGGGSWSPDQYSEITIAALGPVNTDIMYLVVRQDSVAHTLYLLIMPAAVNSGYTLYAVVAGTLHQLATASSPTAVAGDIWRLTVVGTLLTITRNGVIIASVTDTNNYVTAGAPGFGIKPNTVALDQVSLWSGGGRQATSSSGGGSGALGQQILIGDSSSLGVRRHLNG